MTGRIQRNTHRLRLGEVSSRIGSQKKAGVGRPRPRMQERELSPNLKAPTREQLGHRSSVAVRDSRVWTAGPTGRALARLLRCHLAVTGRLLVGTAAWAVCASACSF